MQHITEWPKGLKKRPCTHKPTAQFFAILEEATNIETTGGTTPARPGDALMLAADGETVYGITAQEFAQCYDVTETPTS